MKRTRTTTGQTAMGSWSRRRFLRAAGVSGAAALALPGCGGGGGGALGGGSDGEVTELVVPTASTPWVDAYKAVLAEYENSSGISVTVREFPYEGLVTQYTNDIQSGAGTFDLFQLDEPWTGEFYDKEWAQPVSDVSSGWSLDSETITYADLPFWDPKARASSPDGKPMGLPYNGNVELLTMRSDVYEDLGLETPRTWQDAIENGNRAMSKKAVEFGYAPRAQAVPSGQSITYTFMPVFYSYGADWFAEPGKDWTPTVNTSEAIEAITTYRELARLGPPETNSLGQAEVIALMQSGRLLQTHTVAAASSQFLDPDASNVADAVSFAELPAGPAGIAPTSGTWTLAIPAGLPENRAKAAADLLTWLGEREQQQKFADEGGIPNRHDVLADVTGEASAYLKPYAQSLEKDIYPSIRYVFNAAMLKPTEQVLASITAGDTEPKKGMNQLQDELTSVVRDAGFLD